MTVLIAAHLGWFHRQVVREGHGDLARGFLIAQSTGVDRLCEYPKQRVKSHQLLKKKIYQSDKQQTGKLSSIQH